MGKCIGQGLGVFPALNLGLNCKLQRFEGSFLRPLKSLDGSDNQIDKGKSIQILLNFYMYGEPSQRE